MDNLPQLRDIHLPPEVSAFPPGYGWLVIAAVLMSAFLFYRLFKLWRQKSKKFYALRLLDKSKSCSVKSAREISRLLRRICLYKYPAAASLTGQSWLEFLNARSRIKLSGMAAEILIFAPYVPDQKTLKLSCADFQKLWVFTRQWIGENL